MHFRMLAILFLGSFVAFYANAQTASEPSAYYVVQARVVDGDTIPYIELPPMTIFAPLTFKNWYDEWRFNRLVKHVKRVYPYAKLAGIKLNEYHQMLAGVDRESEKHRLMKQAEQEFRDEFEEDLKNLTFTQGRILMKLVDRETGNTSYELLVELRGMLKAVFWQTFARIFGYNLKEPYDPQGKDKDIETIVTLIEHGVL